MPDPRFVARITELIHIKYIARFQVAIAWMRNSLAFIAQ